MFYAIFGLRYVGHPLDFPALVIQALYLYPAVTGYGLLWSKDWGVMAGLTLCIVYMILALGAGTLAVRGEVLFQVPFIIQLLRIRKEWTRLGERIDPFSDSIGHY